MSSETSATPYWRLSGFYFIYFSSIGAFVPYLGPYLDSLDVSTFQIGVLVAIAMSTKIIAPNIWGWIADHTGKRMRIVQLGCLFAAIFFSILLIDQSFWMLLFVLTLFSFFWNAALPQFEATTLNHLKDNDERYSSIRLWGSIGFVIAVVVLGYVYDEQPYSIFPYIILVLLVSIWMMSLSVPEKAAGHLPIDPGPLKQILRKPHVAGLLLTCFFMQASHGSYYAFFNLYMESYGYTSNVIGWFWGIGVTAEVILLMFSYKLLQRYSLRNLLIVSLFLAAVRWSLTAFFPAIAPVMVVAQLLHAVTFGLYHICAIRLIHQLFRGRHQGKGQALYSSLSFGAGGAVGSFVSGFLWDYLGKVWIYYAAIAFALIGLWFAYKYIQRDSAGVETK